MANDMTVHVIDDDDAARDSLAFLLDCAGLTARTYASADAFLKARPPLDHACLITDVRMPGLSGIELMHALKAQGQDVPVIVITGHADVPLAIQAMKAGAAEFIEKPFSDEAILGAIRSAIDRRADGDALETERRQALARIATLSQREREVLEGLVAGHANKVIAFDLDISVRTVEVYRANAMSKLHARSLSEAVRMMTIAELAGRGGAGT
jgi:two-component system response regulator FixJ